MKCHDCKEEITGEARELILAGHPGKFYKHAECWEKNKALQNIQECEVYSRVVGYLRPISQWNKGKIAEYEKRKMFDMTKEKT